jgi:DNA-binding response OmpR family regulator
MRILLLHLDPARGDEIAASLAEHGHAVTTVTEALTVAEAPDVFVVCPEASPQLALDLAARIGADASLAAVSILFAGGTQAALTEAQRRFPRASFTRLDALATALASMEN